MPRSISRRTLLRGAVRGIPVAVALPALEVMLDGNGAALAQGQAKLPRRFGVWYFGGGVFNSTFFPKTVGPAWTPSEMLMPLLPHRDYVTVVSGTEMKAKGTVHNCHRGFSVANSWTPKPGNTHGNPTEPSLDQLVAEAWAGQTKIESLQLGVTRKNHYQMSWKRGHVVQPREHDPVNVFNRLFGGGLPQADGVRSVLASHRSVLDAVGESSKRLAARVGAPDRARLEAHLEAVREIERRLVATPPAVGAGGCAVPPQPTLTSTGDIGHEDLEGMNRAMADLLVMALACDLTRVFSFQFAGAQTHCIFWQVGIMHEHHPMTHEGPYYDVGMKVPKFIMGQLAYLVDKLKATPEGDGNLLDSLLMYTTSEFLDASPHTFHNHPFLLVGKARGAIKAGVHLKAMGENMAKVMFAAVRAVDVPITGLGDKDKPCYATEPLAGLLA